MKAILNRTAVMTLLIAATIQISHAQPTTLDPGFADEGVLVAPNTNLLNFQNSFGIVEMSDGYYLGLGNKGVNLGFLEIRMTLMKYDICGVPDSTFGVNGLSSLLYQNGVYLEVVSAQELPDGKILCAGNYSSGGAVSSARPALIRLLPDGTFDTTYGDEGVILIQPGNLSSGNFGNMIKIPGDKIVASVGRYPHIGGGSLGVGLVRTLPDGTPDPAFGTAGVSVYSYPGMGYSQAIWERVHLVNDSTYWLTRAESQDGGSAFHPVIYAYDTSGTVRQDFGVNGRLQDPTLMLVGTGREIESTIDPQGRLLIAIRKYLVIEGSAGFEMGFMRYLPDGTIDTSFGDNGYTSSVINIPATANIWPSTLAVNADESIRATFVLGMGTSDHKTVMIQLDQDGLIIPGSQVQIPQANTGITALIQIDDDRWLAQAFGSFPTRHQSQLRFSDNPIVLPGIELTGSNLTATGSGPDFQWYLEGEAISGATGAIHTPGANGNYTVMMTDVLGCPHTSNTFLLTTVNTAEHPSASLHLINNPVNDQLMLLNDFKLMDFEIFNINGQRMSSGQLNHGMNSIQVSDLAKGIYLLRAVHEDIPTTHRFVKH